MIQVHVEPANPNNVVTLHSDILEFRVENEIG